MVGDQLNKNIVVIIYSTIELVNGNSAGSARVMNYARALSVSCDVILLTFERLRNISHENLIEIESNIFTCGQKLNSNRLFTKLCYFVRIFIFLSRIDALMQKIGSSKKISLLFYPTTKTLIDYLTVIFLIKNKKHRIFYEVNEIRKYSTDFEINPLQFKSMIQKFKFIYSEKLTKYFTGLICISTNIEKYFRKYNSTTILIPILSNPSIKKYKKKISYKINDIFRIGFFGSVSFIKENLQLFLESLVNLKKLRPNLNFVVEFYGSIDLKNKIQLKLTTLNLGLSENIFYMGQLEQSNVICKMNEFHLLILPRGNNLQNRFGFSTKLSEYLQSGVPCLVTNVSDNTLYIRDNENGFIIEPDNKEAMVKKLIFIVENYNEVYSKIVNSSFLTVKRHFYYSNYSTILTNFICSKE